MSDAPPLQVLLLGPIEARRAGAVVSLGGRRQRGLLALLASSAGRRVSVDTLVEELFAGDPTDRAEVTLRTYVSRLRRALGQDASIVGAAGGYMLALPSESIDVPRFERLVRTADGLMKRRGHQLAAESLREALGLWRGRPFGDLSNDGVLRVEAERLEELRLHALESRIEAELSLGLAAELVNELEALVREHPYREAFWRQLMLSLYRSERQADALAAFHRARTALDEQLGIDPGPELQALEHAILSHEVPSAAPPAERHNLPVPLTSFVGRSAELDEVRRRLADSRLVTLTGVGGVGKTRLAIEAARQTLTGLPDGVTFIDLSTVAAPGPVVGAVAAALDVREGAAGATPGRIVAHLRDAETLLVLDNCEHVREAVAALVGEVLRSCAGVRVLATSRAVLGVPGEHEYPVPTLGLGDPAEPSARQSDAIDLFLARADAVRVGLARDEATLAEIARICSDLDGLPLAIELAAARARALAPAEIADRLRDRFSFLVSWRRLTSARHRTLREAMDWSHDLLAPDEQVLLRRLSVFVGGFTLDAAAALAPPARTDDALDVLERLVEASLVLVESGHEPTRYRMLETVRQYAAERLEAAGEIDAARAAHAAYFVRLAEAAAQPIQLEVASPWLLRLRADSENLRVAHEWAVQAGDWDAAIALAESAWWFWWVRGELGRARAWLEAALDHAADAEPARRASLELGLAGICWAQGDLDTAQRAAERAASAFASAGAGMLHGSALNTLGLVAHGRRDLATARGLFEAAVEAFTKADDDDDVRRRNLAVAVDNLGSISQDEGRLALAVQEYERAAQINRERADEEGLAMNELHLAMVLGEMGALEDARRRLTRALPVFARLEFHQYTAECLEVAAVLANRRRRPDMAAFLLGAALAFRDLSGNQPVPSLLALRAREESDARRELGNETMDARLAEGRASPPGVAVARGLAFLEAPPSPMS